MAHAENKVLRILGVGQPLLDIIARVKKEFLSERELDPNSMILQVENEKTSTIFEDLELQYSKAIEYVSGGATLNSIRVAQSLLKKAGATGFVGCIGADTSGNRIKNLLKQLEISTAFLESQAGPTGKCAVLVSKNGDRSMVTTLGVSAKFDASYFYNKDVQSLFCSCDIIYSSGFFSRIMPTNMKEYMLQNGKIFVLNLAAPWAVNELTTLFPMTDILFGNEPEFQALSELKEVSEIACDISLLPYKNNTKKRIVICTQGAKDTIVAENGKFKLFPVKEIAQSQIVDTNGAGDAFVGGFLASYAHGAKLEDCISVGHWAAKRIIQQVGVPDLTDFDERCTAE